MTCASYISLPAQEADSLPISSSDTRQLPLLSGTDTPVKSSACVRRNGSLVSESTNKTSGSLIQANTPAAWISSQRAYLVQIGRALEGRAELVSMDGRKSRGVLRSSGRDFFSLNASQDLSASTSGSHVTWLQLISGSAGRFCSMPPAWALRSLGLDIGLLPTPTAKANQLAPSMLKKWASCRRLKKAIRGRLIPAHYEWLMGWPIGFTDSRQSAMGKSRSKQRSRGES